MIDKKLLSITDLFEIGKARLKVVQEQKPTAIFLSYHFWNSPLHFNLHFYPISLRSLSLSGQCVFLVDP